MWQGWVKVHPTMLAERECRMIAPMVIDLVCSPEDWGILADVIDDVAPVLARRLRCDRTIGDLLNTLRLGNYRALSLLDRSKGHIRAYASLCVDARRSGLSGLEASREELALGLVSEAEANGFEADEAGRPQYPPVHRVRQVCHLYSHVRNLVYAGLSGFSVPFDIHMGLLQLRQKITADLADGEAWHG